MPILFLDLHNLRCMDTIPEQGLLTIFLRHRKDLLQFLTYKVSCADTAADLVQETYLRLAHYPEGAAIGNQRAFVFRVADNLALDHLRARTRRERRDGGPLAEEFADAGPEPDAQLAARQQMERLESLIYQLPPQCRSVFLRVRVEGKSYADVAAELGIAPRTVESHMHKALKFIKERFTCE
jgi:RNA polymerase sigma-70 factor (ECF subfamily)